MEDAGQGRELWLLGQPPLSGYLEFVRHGVVGADEHVPAALVDEWRAANDHYHELEQREAGIAERVEVRDLDDPSLAPLAEAVFADPMFRRTFDSVPTRLGMVELDRLVVFQKSVDLDFVEATAARLGPAPTAEDLFRLCLPVGGRAAPVQVERLARGRYAFRSPSMDFRLQEVRALEPGQLQGHVSFGPVAGGVGVLVGFGSNFLNAIRSDGRVLLHNGYHRAVALRSRGITHAPCVIQDVTRLDELEVVAKGSVVEDADLYFGAPRPALLKDFFDPRLSKVLPVKRGTRIIEVTVEVKDTVVRR